MNSPPPSTLTQNNPYVGLTSKQKKAKRLQDEKFNIWNIKQRIAKIRQQNETTFGVHTPVLNPYYVPNTNIGSPPGSPILTPSLQRQQEASENMHSLNQKQPTRLHRQNEQRRQRNTSHPYEQHEQHQPEQSTVLSRMNVQTTSSSLQQTEQLTNTTRTYNQPTVLSLMNEQQRQLDLIRPAASSVFVAEDTPETMHQSYRRRSVPLPGPAGSTTPGGTNQLHVPPETNQQHIAFTKQPWIKLCREIDRLYGRDLAGTLPAHQQLLYNHNIKKYKYGEENRADLLMGVVTNLKFDCNGMVCISTLVDPTGTIHMELTPRVIKQYNITEGSALFLEQMVMVPFNVNYKYTVLTRLNVKTVINYD
jgi:hypothetical protein